MVTFLSFNFQKYYSGIGQAEHIVHIRLLFWRLSYFLTVGRVESCMVITFWFPLRAWLGKDTNFSFYAVVVSYV